MQLRNKSTGEVNYYLNRDDIQSRVTSGEFEPADLNSEVEVFAPDGRKKGKVPAANLASAISEGYSVLTPAQKAIQAAVDKNKGLGGQAKTALLQGADELLLGLPELIYDKTANPLDVAKKEAIKKENALANTVGGISGFAGGLFVGSPFFKGASAVGEAATKSIASKLGAATAGEVGSRTLGKIAKDAVANTAARAGGLGVEGALLAVPQAITETALGDPEAGAEAIMYGAGAGALVGTGISAAKGLGALSKASARAAIGKFDSATGGETVKDVVQKVQRIFTGVPEGDIEHYIGMVKNNRHLNVPEVETIKNQIDDVILREKDSVDIAKLNYDKVKSEMDDAYRTLRQDYKREGADLNLAGELVDSLNKEKGNLKKLSDEALDLLEMNPEVTIPRNAMLNNLGDAIESLKVKGEGGAKVLIGDANNAAAAKIQQRMAELSQLPEAIPLPTVKNVIKSLDRDLNFGLPAGQFNDAQDVILKNFRKEFSSTLKLVNDDYAKKMEEISARSETLKEMSKVFGDTRRAVNTLGRVATGRDKIADELLTRYEAQTGNKYKELFSDLFNKKSLADEASLKYIPEKLVPGLYAKEQEALAALRKAEERFEPIKRLSPRNSQSIITRSGYKNASIEDRRALEKLSEYAGEDLTEKIKDRLVADSFAKERTNGSRRTVLGMAVGSALGTTLGTVVGGPIGGAIGAAIGAGGDVYAGQLVKAIIDKSPSIGGILFTEQSLKKVANKIDSIPDILKNIKDRTPFRGSTRTNGIEALRRQMTPTKERDQKENEYEAVKQSHPEKIESFMKLRDKIIQVNTNQAVTGERMAEVGGLFESEGAPKVAQALQGKMATVAKYLYDEMPKPISKTNVFAPRIKWQPSDYELAKFEAKAAVVNDPFIVFDELQRGTLTRSHIEALEVVYPQLKNFIVDKISEELATNGADIPYTQRIKLSLLFGEPLEPNTSPEQVAYFQQTWKTGEGILADQGGEAQPQAQGQEFKADVNLAGQTATDFQQTTNRRSG